MAFNPSFWKGKSVLITGHTGFKGSWMSYILNLIGAKVIGISLEPKSNPNLFSLLEIEGLISNNIQDINNHYDLSNQVINADPEILIHLAAQPLVRSSYEDPMNTFSTNIMGTVNLLESILKLKNLASAVFITTDKVYANNNKKVPYIETDPLGGYDPYSSSKAASEIVIDSYFKSFLSKTKVGIATARAGNVIGGGDWSKDRLLPDIIRAWEKEKAVKIRNPEHIRPWQHVLEPVFGYLDLAEKLALDSKLSDSYNFGPELNDQKTVKEVVEIAHSSFGKGKVDFDTSLDNYHESDWLELDISKAKSVLGFQPKWPTEKAVEVTVAWYADLYKGKNACDLCKKNIEDYLND